jgi:PAS domain-containing protein
MFCIVTCRTPERRRVQGLGHAVAHAAIEKRTLQETLKAQQRALAESEERFRAIADYTYDGESWIGPDGRPLWSSPAVERLTGWSVTECLSLRSAVVLFEDDDVGSREHALERLPSPGCLLQLCPSDAHGDHRCSCGVMW